MGSLFGGSNDSAQKQAAAQNAQTQQDIAAAESQINSIYDNPELQKQYDKLGADTTAYYTQDVNHQQEVNARQLKFAMARQGLAGGSEQAYQGGELAKSYDKALLQASQAGQSAEANLKSADEQSRQNLIAMAQAGLSGQTAANEATGSLAANLQAGEATATANQLGNAFGDFSQLYQNSQNQKALQQGLLYGYGSVFSPMYGAGGQPASLYGGGE